MNKASRRIALGGLLALAASVAVQSSAQTYQRALENYRAVIAGRKKLGDLSADEQQEVYAVARALSRRAPTDKSSECRSAWDTANSARDELSDRAKRLMRCADDSDLRDDCETELRRARSAQDDFSSAVSNVQSSCRD